MNKISILRNGGMALGLLIIGQGSAFAAGIVFAPTSLVSNTQTTLTLKSSFTAASGLGGAVVSPSFLATLSTSGYGSGGGIIYGPVTVLSGSPVTLPTTGGSYAYTATVSGLSCGTSYNYFSAASALVGTTSFSYGLIGSFSTLPCSTVKIPCPATLPIVARDESAAPAGWNFVAVANGSSIYNAPVVGAAVTAAGLVCKFDFSAPPIGAVPEQIVMPFTGTLAGFTAANCTVAAGTTTFVCHL